MFAFWPLDPLTNEPHKRKILAKKTQKQTPKRKPNPKILSRMIKFASE